MRKNIVIATRGSQLALWQANHVQDSLKKLYPDISVEIKIIKTRGDIIQDVPLAKMGGKGLFVKEIEEALLSGTADLAVHSMKDVPMVLPDGLTLCCVPKREICTDSLVSLKYATLDDLPKGARVGTSSLRRQSQILAMRPDLQIAMLRGNVDTRLRKLNEGEYDAIILASAGMKRLGLTAPCVYEFSPSIFLPSVGQGALGIECAESNKDIIDMFIPMEDTATRVCVQAERAFLRRLDGGCQVPIAGYATLDADAHIQMQAMVADINGSPVYRRQSSGLMHDAENIGISLAEELLKDGAQEILQRLYGENQIFS